MMSSVQRACLERARVLAATKIADAPRWTVARDAAIIAADGRYSDIARLAERWGLSSATVTARWHILRAR